MLATMPLVTEVSRRDLWSHVADRRARMLESTGTDPASAITTAEWELARYRDEHFPVREPGWEDPLVDP